jgi:hypothetical protein
MRAEEIAEDDFTPDSFKDGIRRFLAELLKRQRSVANEQNGKTGGFLRIAEYSDLIGSPVYLIRRNGKPLLAYSSFYFDRPIDQGQVPYFKWIDKGKDSFIHQIDSYIMDKWERSLKKDAGAAA